MPKKFDPGLLSGPRPAAPAARPPYPVSGPEAGAAGPEPAAPPPAPLVRGPAFSTSLEAEGPLPEAVAALRPELREIARAYIGARRRSGRALLEAARWLREARDVARHGEWDDFLAATGTTPDTAERLTRIYDMAMQHPAFAEAVADGRFSQSVAERLARASTPATVVEVILAAPAPPTVGQVDMAIRQARQGAGEQMPHIAASGPGALGGQIPQIAESGLRAMPGPAGAPGGQIPQIAESGPAPLGLAPAEALARLRAVAGALAAIAASGALPAGPEAEEALGQAEAALRALRGRLLRP